MATVTSTIASYNRSIPPSSVNFHMSDSPSVSRQNRNSFFTDANPVAPRVGHSLDDMDILSLKRQYANLDLFEQSTLSNSAEDLSQLERIPYQFEIFGQDQNDPDDDDIPYEEGADYDYPIAIQERLKKANAELEHDQTPSELKHNQRVSFDAVVKAVDIVQDPNEYGNADPMIRPCVSPVAEEPPTILTSPRSDTSTHEYTVPLNDTQPKQGLSLLEQIKALQFHSTQATNDRWATTATNVNNDSLSNREDDLSLTSFKSNENHIDSQDISNLTSNSTSSKKSMIVAVNGQFDLQDEDDYIAKHQMKSSNSDNKNVFLPTPPTEPKRKQDLPPRPFPVRPKSSSDKNNKTEINNRQRPKSAGTLKSVEINANKSSSGVDFDELLRKAAEKKRAELKEERRKKEEADEKREIELAKAKESYERWLQEKDLERKRINEMKRLEKEEEELRQAEQEKELTELREKKYKQWLERKDNEAMLLNEFRKLQANEEAEGSSSSMNNVNRMNNHRAFQKWLRRKYEQSLEEKRQLRVESKRHRRRHRRSIKRNQLQQDLQLAKSFGYS